MQAAPDAASDRARNEAFRRIGRNVYFFQLIESALKHLIIHGDVEGNVSELARVIEQKGKKVARQPMGHLVDSLVKEVYQRAPANKERPAELREAWFSFKYKIEADPGFARARKTALNLLVKERNDLIHRQLPEIPPDSTERWLRLSADLDAQRERLVAEFNALRSMIRALTDLQIEAFREIDAALAAAQVDTGQAQSP